MTFNLSLSEFITDLDAKLTGHDIAVSGISIDTRTLKSGNLFVAIHGDRFNGHEFVKAAEKAGAAALLVHEEVSSSLPVLMVKNTQTALGQLARHWARRFKIPTIAITGSNGKTTVKEIVASILRQQGPVLATEGNLNNEIGVPLTLLRMRENHMYAVIEMGANHAGEIARLAAIAEPDVALVNNIGSAHLEGFGSIEGIAQAKSEIYSGLANGGYAVINADDTFADHMRKAASHCQVREFGFTSDVDVQGVPGAKPEIRIMETTLMPKLSLPGEHNFKNSLAAVAAVQCLDIPFSDIVRGLEQVVAVPGRLERKPGLDGSVVIDDTYNANPDSLQSAMKVLARCPGTRYLVLGDMAELGDEAKALHHAMGRDARVSGIDGLWTVGALASHAFNAFMSHSDEDAKPAGSHCSDKAELIKELQSLTSHNITLLIKGSRSARMEDVVNALLAEPSPTRSLSKAGQVS
ncbi:MAG: UDP-N-acetylmuramoyl-tripeptide--D-alanyl-D-alanine ligase [Granulosicoccus sp.]